jgi:Na+:H+ antiporter, NhaC family
MANDSVNTHLKEHNFFTAMTPLFCLIFLLATSVYTFGGDCSSGPNQVALFICAMIAVGFGVWRGQHYDDLERGIVQGISTALAASLILLFIGALIGVWLLSGTVPTLIYYGIQFINVHWFYTCTVIVSAIVSISIGSSWTTAATIGVAFIGMASALNVNPAITAGAIISGAYFGDKMSPLSETTNLAAAVAEVNLFAHIKNMIWTTVPSLIIAIIIFTILGFYQTADTVANETPITLLKSLEDYYHISLLNLVPLVVLIVLAIMKVPALLTIFFGTLVGAIEALLLQGNTISLIFAHDNDVVSNLISLWSSAYNGIEINTQDAEFNSLLSGGGMNSMLNTIFLVIAALSFGAAMETTGALGYIIKKVLLIARNVRGIICSTILTCIGVNIISGDQYMSIIMPGRMYKQAYKKLNLKQTALSRSLEDGGTITSVLVPWNTCAVYISGVLGVTTFAYLPYCFFNIINPIIAIIFGFIGFKIASHKTPTIKKDA